jgi:adenosylcobinamide amidohydrolase
VVNPRLPNTPTRRNLVGVSIEPVLTRRSEGGRDVPVLVWRLPEPLRAISSASLGGGIGERWWVVNATVPIGYDRDDPDVHLTALAAQLGLAGSGVGLLTAVDVAKVVRATDGDVVVWATVGLGQPEWAAAPGSVVVDPVGTVNLVVHVPARLGDAALVNAVATATEAKAQAIVELGLAATGTATDAVTVLCVPDGPVEAYGGPRSRWGARLARAVHRAVLAGGRDYGPGRRG